jgi:hypothetical protein
MLGFLSGVDIHPVNDEAKQLAERYLTAAVFTAAMHNDALHAAAAAVARADVLLSWNFKHLVNRRRLAVNSVNINSGFPVVDIIAPPEL